MPAEVEGAVHEAAAAGGADGPAPPAVHPPAVQDPAAAPAVIDEGLLDLLAMNDVAPELSQALAVAGVVKLTDLHLFTSEGGTPISWGSALLSLVRAHPGNGGLPDSLAHKVRRTSKKRIHPRSQN